MTPERVGTAIGVAIILALVIGSIAILMGPGCDAACAEEQQQRVDDRNDYFQIQEWKRAAEDAERY